MENITEMSVHQWLFFQFDTSSLLDYNHYFWEVLYAFIFLYHFMSGFIIKNSFYKIFHKGSLWNTYDGVLFYRNNRNRNEAQ